MSGAPVSHGRLPVLGFTTDVNNDVWSDSNPSSAGLTLEKRGRTPQPLETIVPLLPSTVVNSNRPPTQECWTRRTQPHSTLSYHHHSLEKHTAKDGVTPVLDSQLIPSSRRCTASKASEMAAWFGGFKSLFVADPIQSSAHQN